MGKFLQCLTELSTHDTIMAGYYNLMFLFGDVLIFKIITVFTLDIGTHHLLTIVF